MALRQSCEKLRVVKMLAGGRCWAALTGERRDMGTHSQTNLKIRCFSVITYQRRKDMKIYSDLLAEELINKPRINILHLKLTKQFSSLV